MNETKFEPFKKAVAVACVLMACGIMSSMCFAPEQVQNEYDAEPCAYFTLPTPEYTRQQLFFSVRKLIRLLGWQRRFRKNLEKIS